MTDSSRSFVAMEWIFLGLGVLGLAGTWAQAFGYLGDGFLAGNVAFWRETVATPASTFITVDLLVLAAALFVWMFAEGRRLGIAPAWLWAYFLVSTLIGISFAVPVFLAHRHRRIRTNGHGGTGAPAGADWIAIGIAILIAVTAVAYSLGRPH
jgi:Terpene cyclase DEP1